MKRVLAFTAVLAALILAWFLWRSRASDSRHPKADGAPAAPQSKIENRKSKIPSPVDATEAAIGLNAPGGTARADLQVVADLLATYRSNFLREGNPVGNNAEITAALRGDNRLRLVFIPDRHPALNAAGELCDRWGTPYFFHAASGTEMEIRSAGLDRKLHTTDDLVLGP